MTSSPDLPQRRSRNDIRVVRKRRAQLSSWRVPGCHALEQHTRRRKGLRIETYRDEAASRVGVAQSGQRNRVEGSG